MARVSPSRPLLCLSWNNNNKRMHMEFVPWTWFEWYSISIACLPSLLIFVVVVADDLSLLHNSFIKLPRCVIFSAFPISTLRLNSHSFPFLPILHINTLLISHVNCLKQKRIERRRFPCCLFIGRLYVADCLFVFHFDWCFTFKEQTHYSTHICMC